METISNKDKREVLELIENDPYIHIWDVSEELRNDPEIVLAFARKDRNAMLIEYAGEKLKADKDFLIQIAKCDENGYDSGLAMVLQYASDTVKNDKQFFIEILQKYGDLYRYIGDSLKNDDDLKMISAISNLGEKFNGYSVKSFEDKVNIFLSRVKNGVNIPGETKARPYSFSAELRNYELHKNNSSEFGDKIQEESIYVQESPEEIEKQVEILEHIKEVVLNKEKVQATSLLQQREAELSSLEAEAKAISEAENLIEEQKDEQSIGE